MNCLFARGACVGSHRAAVSCRPGGSLDDHQALAKFRAVEHRRYLVRATNSGPSSIVDPLGRSLEEAPLFERSARMGSVRLLKSSTPYEVLGDGPWWLATLVALMMAWVRRPLSTPSQRQPE